MKISIDKFRISVNKRVFNLCSTFIFLFFLLYIIYLFYTNESVNMMNFLLITYFSHIFFLVIIPLEGLFLIKVKHLISTPFFLIFGIAFIGTLSFLTNYYIGKNFNLDSIKAFIGKRKFNNYKKKYDKYGKYLFFIAASTPFLPAPIFSLLEGFFQEDKRRIIILGFLGLVVKWSIFYFMFKGIGM